MASSRRSRVVWPRLAGLVVLLDGFLSVLAAGAFLLVSTIFRPIAAVQGREPVEQSWLLEALVAAGLAIVGVWAGQRAIRGIRNGRLAGAAVAGVIAVYVGWYLVTGDAGSTEATVAWAGIVAIHAVAALVLVAWPAPGEDRTLPAAKAVTNA